MNLPAVIFDMDGVIVDSEPLYTQHETVFLKSLGIDTTVHPSQSYPGQTAQTLWTTMKQLHNLDQDVDELIRTARASYVRFLEKLPEIPIVPGVRELLNQLSLSGYQMAVASSANPKRIDLFMKRLGLSHYFQFMLSADDITNGKPHPEIYLLAACKLSRPASECIVIEDAKAGVMSAKAAGMTVMGFAGLPHNQEDLSQSDVIINDFYQLIEHLQHQKPLTEFH